MAKSKAPADDRLNKSEMFYRELENKHLVALWNITSRLLPSEPQTKVRSYLWKWSELRDLAYRAATLFPLLFKSYGNLSPAPFSASRKICFKDFPATLFPGL